jgi:hypothetical protein
MVFQIDPVEGAFLLPIDAEYNVRDLREMNLPDGRIFVSLVCKDDGPVLNDRPRFPDVPVFRALDNETDALAWKAAIPHLLKAVKREFTAT